MTSKVPAAGQLAVSACRQSNRLELIDLSEDFPYDVSEVNGGTPGRF
jgi:hypothetical protein